MKRQLLETKLLVSLGQPEEIHALIADTVVFSILSELMQDTKRFSALVKKGVSSKTLSNRLKRLESQGLITRTLHAEVPPRVEYALTEKGLEFIQFLSALSDWHTSWE